MQEFYYCLDLFVRRLFKTSVRLATDPATVWDLLMVYKVILTASFFSGLQSLYARINSFVSAPLLYRASNLSCP
jgi:hypothetical protein